MEEVKKPALNFDEDSQDEEATDPFGMSFNKRAEAPTLTSPRPSDSVPKSPPSSGSNKDTGTDKGTSSPEKAKSWWEVDEEEDGFDLMQMFEELCDAITTRCMASRLVLRVIATVFFYGCILGFLALFTIKSLVIMQLEHSMTVVVVSEITIILFLF